MWASPQRTLGRACEPALVLLHTWTNPPLVQGECLLNAMQRCDYYARSFRCFYFHTCHSLATLEDAKPGYRMQQQLGRQREYFTAGEGIIGTKVLTVKHFSEFTGGMFLTLHRRFIPPLFVVLLLACAVSMRLERRRWRGRFRIAKKPFVLLCWMEKWKMYSFIVKYGLSCELQQ